MEAVVSLSPYNKQIKGGQRNRQSRSVFHLVRGQSENIYATAKVNYYPQFASFSDGYKQPPLLPLPVVVPKAQTNTFSPSKKKEQKLTRHQSLTPRKSPPPKPQIVRRPDNTKAGRLGPDPNDLPRVMFMAAGRSAAVGDTVDRFFAGESVFMLAPPPSSLPLPKFSLRPKLSCNAEAGVDAGATDGLRPPADSPSPMKFQNVGNIVNYGT